MSFEGFGQGKGRKAEAEYRSKAEGRGYDPYERKAPGLADIDGSELTPGYEGFRQVDQYAEIATPVPERTEAPADAFPELNVDIEVEDERFEESAAVAAEVVVGEAALSPETVPTSEVEATVSVDDSHRDEIRKTRLADLEKGVESYRSTPSTQASLPQKPEKRSWFSRLFGG